MKSVIQKGIIPARTQSQDKKFQTSRPCEVRRSGQVTTFVVCAVLSLSFQAVVLLTKATITRCDLSATILFKLVDSYLIAFKFAQ